jgi:peptide/nickel transport system substrate-binding protein
MPKNPPENHPNREGSPVREAFLQPRITRRSALKMAGAAALPALIRRARAADGSVLRVAFAVQPATLDPQKMRVGGLEYNAAAYVFNRLTTQDAQLRVLPDLATSWEASPDLKTWTFHLRPGVKFHNGKPFDASDVLFTYKRILDKEVGCVLRVNFSIVSNIEAVDPLTVRFTLSAPYSDLPAAMAAYQALIVSESMMDTLTTHPIGTGPFRFVEYRPGDQMTLERNPDYFLPGVPTLDRAILRIIPEFTTAVAALESGAVDVVFDLPPEQVDNLKRSTVAHTEEVVTGRWSGIIWNCEMKPFDDPRVRRAFNKLVDKPVLTDIATFGHGTPTLTPIPPFHPYYRKDIAIGGADIPGAKKLLAEAGIPDGFALEMWVPGANPPRERYATAFRDAAKQVGINVQLRMVPPDKFFAEMEGKVLFSADGFYGRATPDLMLYPWYHSTGSWNNTLWHYHNPEVDKILDAARATTDTTEQAKLYGRFQEMLVDDSPGSIIYVQNFACGVSNKVQNVSITPLMLLDITKAALTA